MTKRGEMSEKDQAFALLRANGLTIKQAESALGFKDRVGYAIERRLKKQHPSSLTDPAMVATSHKAIKRLAKGQLFGDIKEVKADTVLKAAEAIADRHEPKINMNQNLNINADISPVDLSAYRTGSSTPEGE